MVGGHSVPTYRMGVNLRNISLWMTEKKCGLCSIATTFRSWTKLTKRILALAKNVG
jgi:hypothetical protein